MSDPHELSLYIFGEHFFGVDGDECAAAAGQDFVFFVEDFGSVDVSCVRGLRSRDLRRGEACAGEQA